jgi:death-on-curing protein
LLTPERVDVQYLTTDDYFAIASRILEIDAGILARRSGQEGLTTIGSALAAPATGWGTVDLYETWPRKIGVLGWRLATRQVLPDGNKRTAFLCMVLFARRNGFEWPDLDTDEVVHVMTAVGAGVLDEEEFIGWVGRIFHHRAGRSG